MISTIGWQPDLTNFQAYIAPQSDVEEKKRICEQVSELILFGFHCKCDQWKRASYFKREALTFPTLKHFFEGTHLIPITSRPETHRLRGTNKIIGQLDLKVDWSLYRRVVWFFVCRSVTGFYSWENSKWGTSYPGEVHLESHGSHFENLQIFDIVKLVPKNMFLEYHIQIWTLMEQQIRWLSQVSWQIIQ